MSGEAIILAGGLGTRLRERVPDLPKPLAPVAGRPFLYYVISYLLKEGIQKVVFALGYKHELISDYVSTTFPELNAVYFVEDEPLGTGGAIRKALEHCTSDDVYIVNGDTLFQANLREMHQTHLKQHALCTIALKPMQHFNRYGTVIINDAGRILKFEEKKEMEKGLINGGIYLINRTRFMDLPMPVPGSFERDFLEKYAPTEILTGVVHDKYFIDIGIPEDFDKAHIDFQPHRIPYSAIHPNWSLFLDRDGVINVEKENDYINSWDEFKFYEGIENAFRIFSGIFKHILIVTNQRGVGKGITNEEALKEIHQKLSSQIRLSGGRIDALYYCTALEDHHPNRKPNPGMGLQAMEDFPDIIPQQSIMVGNNMSDMAFGKNVGMYTVLLTTTLPEPHRPHPLIDAVFPSLISFAQHLHDNLSLKS
ncbi:MAG TPA: HAD-IIIA family hydrolase [Ferruginibacter sp.]|nr:HAD-IIIA family hydrolase [Ferruginibacter sp.]HRO17195.1 HAD-IIIA family hydrolase [Ferruginibacter sp.]HRQ19782.1 HAD-IIIA family hydrolase [Ferruginibacter sp.]